MVATDLPSISRWTARSHPKFGALSTIRRPSLGLPCATVLMEIAHTKARIRRALLTKLCLGFMAHNYAYDCFSPVADASNFYRIATIHHPLRQVDSRAGDIG